MRLIDRIDLALQQARKSRHDLADAIGVSTQAISNLKRRPGSTLRPENVAKAARFLACDLYWLCTGEPEEYQPEQPRWGFLATEIANHLDALPADRQQVLFAVMYQALHQPNLFPLVQPPKPWHPEP
jgi:transcriptional regulator with XRE-family HTH domain